MTGRRERFVLLLCPKYYNGNKGLCQYQNSNFFDKYAKKQLTSPIRGGVTEGDGRVIPQNEKRADDIRPYAKKQGFPEGKLLRGGAVTAGD